MAFFIMLLSMVFYAAATDSIRPIVSLFADMQGVSPFVIGILVSAYSLFPMMLALTVGKWMDRYGAHRLATLGGISAFVAVFIPVLFPNLIILFFSQLLLGFGQVSWLVAYQKTVGNMLGDRDKNIMWFALTLSTGEFLGPMISGFSFEHYGIKWTFAIAAILVMAGIILGSIFNREVWRSGEGNQTAKNTSLMTSFNLLKQTNLRKAIILSGLVLYSKDIFVAYFPVYGNSIGLSASQIGMILASVGAMAALIRFSQYWLVNTFGRSKVIFTMLIISGLSFAMIPFFTWVPALFIFAGLIGAGLGLGQPISLVYALNFSSKERHGEVLGMRLTLNKGSQFAAPFLFGAIGGIAGFVPIFIVNGLILFAGAFGTRMKEEASSSSSEPQT